MPILKSGKNVTENLICSFLYTHMNAIEVGKLLNTGKFGKIHAAKWDVAIKILEKSNMIKREIAFDFEINIHKRLEHPNIIKLLGHYEDEKHIYLILELCAQDLYELMKTKPGKKIEEPVAIKYLHDVALGIQYCHSKQIIHRDIKPENILITAEGAVKICDFGWAADISTDPRRKTLCGTVDYVCPEMVLDEPYSYECDIWCLGVLLYEMICGIGPFYGKNYTQTYYRISKVDLIIPGEVSQPIANMLKKILVRNPEMRMPVKDIICHCSASAAAL
jgi:serine/threonine protein kinase